HWGRVARRACKTTTAVAAVHDAGRIRSIGTPFPCLDWLPGLKSFLRLLHSALLRPAPPPCRSRPSKEPSWLSMVDCSEGCRSQDNDVPHVRDLPLFMIPTINLWYSSPGPSYRQPDRRAEQRSAA